MQQTYKVKFAEILKQSFNYVVDNCYFENSLECLNFIVNGDSNITIQNCMFTNSCVTVENSNSLATYCNLNIENCFFQDNAQITNGYGCIEVKNNSFNSTVSTGAQLCKLSIKDCFIYEDYIKINNSKTYLTVDNCYMYNSLCKNNPSLKLIFSAGSKLYLNNTTIVFNDADINNIQPCLNITVPLDNENYTNSLDANITNCQFYTNLLYSTSTSLLQTSNASSGNTSTAKFSFDNCIFSTSSKEIVQHFRLAQGISTSNMYNLGNYIYLIIVTLAILYYITIVVIFI